MKKLPEVSFISFISYLKILLGETAALVTQPITAEKELLTYNAHSGLKQRHRLYYLTLLVPYFSHFSTNKESGSVMLQLAGIKGLLSHNEKLEILKLLQNSSSFLILTEVPSTVVIIRKTP